MNKFRFKLYVAGQTPRSQQAVTNLRQLCEESLPGRYDMEVIDVLQHPDLAEDERILATPTLVKLSPTPIRRVIGDLSDFPKVRMGLELDTPGEE